MQQCDTHAGCKLTSRYPNCFPVRPRLSLHSTEKKSPLGGVRILLCARWLHIRHPGDRSHHAAWINGDASVSTAVIHTKCQIPVSACVSASSSVCSTGRAALSQSLCHSALGTLLSSSRRASEAPERSQSFHSVVSWMMQVFCLTFYGPRLHFPYDYITVLGSAAHYFYLYGFTGHINAPIEN